MKPQLDHTSITIGFLCAVILTAFVSFKDSADATRGRFQTTMGEKGIVILDTQSGDYIMSQEIFPKWKWIRGNFNGNTMDR